jgi:hypothetical protein
MAASVAMPAAMAARAGSFARSAKIRSNGSSKRFAPARRGGAVVVRAAAARDDQPSDYKLKYLYDGGCTVCNALVKLLKSKRGHEKIWCAFQPRCAPPSFRRPRMRRVRVCYPTSGRFLVFFFVAPSVPS